MSWNFQAKWPMRPGDEINVTAFDDLRKIFYAFRNIGWNYGGWTNKDGNVQYRPYNYDAETWYYMGEFCYYQDAWWRLNVDRLKGIAPPGGGWIPHARWDNYDDYDRDSGKYWTKWNDDSTQLIKWPAYHELPPQFDPEHNNTQVECAYAHEESGFYGPYNQGLFALITGPIGARYQNGVAYGSLANLAYAIHGTHSYGSYLAGSQYHETKFQGYQSFAESVLDAIGAQGFMAKTDGSWHDDNISGEDDTWAYVTDGRWGCNRSAFEWCLRQYDAANAEPMCDWYLDVMNPPMIETGAGYVQMQACWRRTWRYSFGGPPGGIMWPGEKGPPPYYDTETPHLEQTDEWWIDSENMQKVYAAIASQLTVDNVKALVRRHHNPYLFTSDAFSAWAEQQIQWGGGFADNQYRLQNFWASMQSFTDYIPTDYWQEEYYFELPAQLLNDVKALFDFITWRYMSFSDLSGWGGWWSGLDDTNDTTWHWAENWDGAKGKAFNNLQFDGYPAWDNFTDEGSTAHLMLGFKADGKRDDNHYDIDGNYRPVAAVFNGHACRRAALDTQIPAAGDNRIIDWAKGGVNAKIYCAFFGQGEEICDNSVDGWFEDVATLQIGGPEHKEDLSSKKIVEGTTHVANSTFFIELPIKEMDNYWIRLEFSAAIDLDEWAYPGDCPYDGTDFGDTSSNTLDARVSVKVWDEIMFELDYHKVPLEGGLYEPT